MKRYPTEWEKHLEIICPANGYINKSKISATEKQLIQLENRKGTTIDNS